MDDQAFGDLMAEAGLDGAVATAPPPESPVEPTDDLGLQGTHSPDDVSADLTGVDDTPAADEPTEVPVYSYEQVEEQARALAQQLVEQQDAERKAVVEQRLMEYAYTQDQQGSQQFEADLEQYDRELAERYRGHRNFVAQRAQHFEEQSQRLEHGINAWTIAVEQRFPELMPDLINEATALMALPSHEAMVQYATGIKQRASQESAQLQALKRQNEELRLRLDAQSRPLAADAVDGGQTGAGGLSFQQRWDNATDMDDVMALIEAM
jgi:hypothetical protein